MQETRKSNLIRSAAVLLLAITVSPTHPTHAWALRPLAMQDYDANELWRAAAGGDLAGIKACITASVPIDSANAYGVTALLLAAEHSHGEIAKWLLDRGADPSVKDRFYGFTPLSWSVIRGQYATITALTDAGANDSAATLATAVQQSNTAVVEAMLAAESLDVEAIRRAAIVARAQEKQELLEQLVAKLPEDRRELPPFDAEGLKRLSGYYVGKDGAGITISVVDRMLHQKLDGSTSSQAVYETDPDQFESGMLKLVFNRDESGGIESVSRYFRTDRTDFDFAGDKAPEAKSASSLAGADSAESAERTNDDWMTSIPDNLRSDYPIDDAPWTGFRGHLSRGVGSSQPLPTDWDVVQGTNLAWKTPIAGLANSCPIVSGNRIYLTTAVSQNSKASGFATGESGDVASVDETDPCSFRLLCLDLNSGELVWEREAFQGIPAVKRHAKSSHANATPVTDGTYIVASFGSEGVYCYDTDGNQIWKRDLGLLDSGWFYDRTYQWGYGSSPCLVDGRVILQCDIQDSSFLIALDLKSGETIWKTERDEIPTWGSPVAFTTSTGVPLVVVSGTHANAAYDSRDGREIWKLGGFSEIVAPTPQVLPWGILLASGYSPVQPLAMVRPDARGELELPEDEQALDEQAAAAFVWSKRRGGPYMSTPLVYDGLMYVCSTSGVLDCYVAATGERIYKTRIRGQGATSFTGSPVAAAGYVYFPSEQGVIKVVRAGTKFELVGSPKIGEPTLSTPAISQGFLLIRGERHLFGLSK